MVAGDDPSSQNLRRVLWFCACLYFRCYTALYLPFFQDIGLSVTQVATLWAMNSIVQAALDSPSSYLADRYSYKWVIWAGSFANLLGFGGLAFAEGYSLAVICMVLLGCGSGLIFGTLSAFARQSTDAQSHAAPSQASEAQAGRRHLEFARSITGIYALAQAGSMLGAILLLLSRPHDGPRLAFALQAVLSLGLVTLSWRFVEPPKEYRQNKSLRKFLGQKQYSPELWRLVWYGALATAGTSVAFFLLQPYCLALGLSEMSAPAAFAVMYLITLAGSRFALRFERRPGQPVPLWGLAGWPIAGFGLLMVLPGYWGFIAWVAFGIFCGIQAPVMDSYLTNAAKQFRATVLSIQLSLSLLLSAAANTGAGWLFDRYGVQQASAAALLGLALPAAGVLWRLRRMMSAAPLAAAS